MKLGHLYRPNEFCAAWVSFLSYPFTSFDVPTEVVIFRGQYVTPTQARAYKTNLYLLHDNKLVEYETLRQLPSFRGAYQYRAIYLVEVWSDQGSDGHISYQRIGYRFVPEATLQLRCRSWTGEDGLPEAMLEQSEDYRDSTAYR